MDKSCTMVQKLKNRSAVLAKFVAINRQIFINSDVDTGIDIDTCGICGAYKL